MQTEPQAQTAQDAHWQHVARTLATSQGEFNRDRAKVQAVLADALAGTVETGGEATA